MAGLSKPTVAHHFEDLPQQHESATLGMWIFLGTEIMFFGTLITAYIVYRHMYGYGFMAAAESMNKFIGTINTGILLTSSLTAALAVHYAREKRSAKLLLCAAFTAALGLIFDGLKFYEYYQHYQEGLWPGAGFRFPQPHKQAAELFYVLYYVITSIHALHVAIGVAIFAIIAVLVYRGRCTHRHVISIENSALYWHFVDIVWIFLYPLFYLVEHTS